MIFDRRINFPPFFAELATDKVDYESLESSFLKVTVAQEMDKHDFSYSNNSDLIINSYINTEEKTRSWSVPTAGAHYDYRNPFYETWDSYGGYETRIDQYMKAP